MAEIEKQLREELKKSGYDDEAIELALPPQLGVPIKEGSVPARSIVWEQWYYLQMYGRFHW
jgi:hypothetical protein